MLVSTEQEEVDSGSRRRNGQNGGGRFRKKYRGRRKSHINVNILCGVCIKSIILVHKKSIKFFFSYEIIYNIIIKLFTTLSMIFFKIIVKFFKLY